MTQLNKPISRQSSYLVQGLPVIITLAPLGAQNEARIGFRLKGRRVQYLLLLSDCYRSAALNHGRKEALARKEARKRGVPWAKARKLFLSQNQINTIKTTT